MNLYLTKGATNRSIIIRLIPFQLESITCNNIVKEILSVMNNYNANSNLDVESGVLTCECTSTFVCFILFEDLFYQFHMHCIFHIDGKNKTTYP